METISESLLSLIEAFPADLTTKFNEAIETSQEELNAINSTEIAERGSASSSRKMCRASALVFGDENIVLPQSSTYGAEQDGYWSQFNLLPTACFVKLSSTIEVAIAVKLATLLNIPFSIRAGGHMPNPGFNSVDGRGVVFDLGGLNDMKLKGDIFSTGPGATWDKIYAYLANYEKVVVGGRVVGIGAGGLLTGGGMSHFPNYWGMACDNVKNYEVVLGNSRVVNANAHENVDLFKALKGGGSNFGIVTRFDLYTFPDYQMWQKVTVYDKDKDDQIANAFAKLSKSMETNNRLGMTIQVQPDTIMTVMWHRGWTSEDPADFQKAFGHIEPKQVLLPGTNATQAVFIAEEPRLRGGFSTTAFRSDARTYRALFRQIHTMSPSLPVRVEWNFQPLVKSSAEQGVQKGGNVLGIAPETQSVLGIVVKWTDAAQDQVVKELMPKLYSSLSETAKAHGNLMDTIFMNDAWYTQDVLSGYGKENLDFMRDVSRKYDAGQIFQNLQNNGFLMSKRDKILSS